MNTVHAGPLRHAGLAGLALGCLLPLAAMAEGKDSTVTVYYPGKDWAMRLTVPGLVEDYNNHKTGVSTYFSGSSATSEIIVSVEMIAAKGARSAGECRDIFHDAIKGRPNVGEMKFTEVKGVPRYETFMAEVMGVPLRQKHVHAVQFRDGVCAKTHVSKIKFQEQDQQALEVVLESARFEPVDAAGSVTRSFVVTPATAVVMKMPVRWGFRKERSRKGMPLGMFIHEPAEEFQMGIRFIDPDGIPGTRDDAFIRRFVEEGKDRMLSSAIETAASLEPLAAKSGRAYFYQVTNKTPVAQQKKGAEWRYLYQGALPLKDYLVIFTIYSNEKGSRDVVAALDLVKELEGDAWRAQ